MRIERSFPYGEDYPERIVQLDMFEDGSEFEFVRFVYSERYLSVYVGDSREPSQEWSDVSERDIPAVAAVYLAKTAMLFLEAVEALAREGA